VNLLENYYVNGNLTLHYYHHTKPDTKPIILIHGIGVSGRYMLPLARVLARSNTVYVIDLPGFGKSSKLKAPVTVGALARAIGDFIRGKSLKQPVLVANSFGCQVSIKVIKHSGNVISKAVLIGPTMNVFERSAAYQIVRWLQNLKYEPTKAMAWILVKDIWECGPIRVFRTLKTGLDDTPEDGLEGIATPILFIRGSLDPIAPLIWLEYLAKNNPGFSVAELPDAGHALNFNSPRPLAKIITDFLRRV
jgi:pimeloyl-ACP methyl ester carboxylesterase